MYVCKLQLSEKSILVFYIYYIQFDLIETWMSMCDFIITSLKLLCTNKDL